MTKALEENRQFEQQEEDYSCDMTRKKRLWLQRPRLSLVILCPEMLELCLDVS